MNGVINMIKTAYDFVMLTLLGFIKLSLFLLFFCFAIFFFVKSKNIAMEEKSAFAGLLAEPDFQEHTHFLEPDEVTTAENNEADIENMTPEEAEVFLFILRFSDKITSANARKLSKLIVEECDNYKNLDPYLILAVIQVESEFAPRAVSNQGAIGLMQVMPETGEYVANENGISYNGRKSLYDPLVNVKLGIRYLSFLAQRYDNTENALAAYNYGPSNFEKALSANRKTFGYVKKVLSFKSYLEEESILLAKNS